MKTNRPVTVRQEQQHERALCSAILALRSLEECRSFFRDLCTPAELQAWIAARNAGRESNDPGAFVLSEPVLSGDFAGSV